jgi:nicotinamide-nucleotide amidase
MNVEIVTIGDELLLGFTVDTNGAHLARELAQRGIAVVRRATCGDSAESIAEAVKDALDRTGAVITTGGLGPTSDDLTKESIAAIFGRAMYLDDSIVEGLNALWKSRGWPGELPKANLQQATIPVGSLILTNRHGSAPGIWIEDERGRWVAMLPGVPREMRGMLADELLPILEKRAVGTNDATRKTIVSRTLRTTGMGESAIADTLGTLGKNPEGVSLAYLPGWEGTDLRLTSRDRTAADAAVAIEMAAVALGGVLGPIIYGEGKDDLAATVLALLRSRKMTVAVAESCTGGLLGARITEIPGASDVMLGGIIAYANEVKEAQLGVLKATMVEHGAVSEQTVREMATGVRTRFGASIGIAISGVAGPGGGSAEKPVGTVCFGLDVNGEVSSVRSALVGDRTEIRQRAAQAALNAIRRFVETH